MGVWDKPEGSGARASRDSLRQFLVHLSLSLALSLALPSLDSSPVTVPRVNVVMNLEGTWCRASCEKLEKVGSFLPGCSQAYMGVYGQGWVLRGGFATIMAIITVV